MKKLSLLCALAAFFVCGTALHVSASEISKVNQQEYVSIDISNEIGFLHSLEFSSPTTPSYEAAEWLACELTTTIKCGTVEIPVTAIGDDCESAGAGVDKVKKDLGCE